MPTVKTSLACIPCLLRPSLAAVTLCGKSDERSQSMAREVLLGATSLDFSRSPPQLAGMIQAQLRDITGCDDPYREHKQRFNALALALRPQLEHAVRNHPDPFLAATRLAIVANVIDVGAKSGISEAEALSVLDTAIDAPLQGDFEAFRVSAQRARRILYLADNAGEIVFDRVLIAQLPRGAVTVAVRGGPVLNDATASDARVAGIHALAAVIDSGASVPGTPLADCSRTLRRRFRDADLVIAKGQGNFETLHDTVAPLFCLFRVKCEIAAEQSGYRIGSNLVWRGSGVGQTRTALSANASSISYEKAPRNRS